MNINSRTGEKNLIVRTPGYYTANPLQYLAKNSTTSYVEPVH